MKTLFLLIVLIPTLLSAQRIVEGDVFPGLGEPKNYVMNPSAIRNASLGVTTSSATLTRDTDAADRIDGIASFLCDTSANGGYCQWNTKAISHPDQSGNCEASVSLKGDASLYQLQLMSGSDVLVQSPALSNLSDWTKVVLNYPCGSTRSIRLTQTTAGTSAAVNVGRVYYGPATNVGNVAQARNLLRAQRITSSQNITTTAATTVIFNGVDSDPLGMLNTSTGEITVRVPGRVGVSSSMSLTDVTASTSSQYYAIFLNGAQTSCRVFDLNATTVRTMSLPLCTLDVVVGDIITLRSSSDSDTNYNVTTTSYVNVIQFPTQSEIAIRPSQAAWYVDANLAGANPSLGTSAVSSYTEITNGSLTLTPATGSAPVGVMCSGTNAAATPSTGATTCAAGNESVGFNVAIPYAGVYEVCGYFSHIIEVVTDGTISSTFQFVETATNAQTILQEGRTRTNSRQTGGSTSGNNNRINAPHANCSLINFSSSGTKGLRLMYEQAVSGTVTGSTIIANEDTALGQPNIRFTMKPYLAPTPAPLLAGSVTSSSPGLETVGRALIGGASSTTNCTASPCTVHSQSGDWITSVTRGGLGSYSVNISGFSAAPSCTCTARDAAVTTVRNCYAFASTSSSVSVIVFYTANTSNGATTSTDAHFSLICMGPR